MNFLTAQCLLVQRMSVGEAQRKRKRGRGEEKRGGKRLRQEESGVEAKRERRDQGEVRFPFVTYPGKSQCHVY